MMEQGGFDVQSPYPCQVDRDLQPAVQANGYKGFNIIDLLPWSRSSLEWTASVLAALQQPAGAKVCCNDRFRNNGGKLMITLLIS